MKGSFKVENPDFTRSPFTGMTKEHYIECAKYILERAFSHVRSMEDPISFPLVPGKTYPQPGAPPWRYRSLEFEALERTFTLAGPLIHVDPETMVGNIKLRDYYHLHLYNALTPPVIRILSPCRRNYPIQHTSSHVSSADCSRRCC